MASTLGRGPRKDRTRSPRADLTARLVALRVIMRVTDEGAYSNLALGAELRRSNLPARDRRLATDLVYGTLRRRVTMDPEIELAAGRPIGEVDPQTAAVLRLGVYQLRHTRIPPHAAVSATVDLSTVRARGFVNAVLRRLARQEPIRSEGDDDRAVALRTGLAAWAVGELRRLLPAQEVEPAAAVLASPATLDLRVNRCRTDPAKVRETLEAAGLQVEPGAHHRDVLRLGSPATPSELAGFDEGWFTIQDEASAVVAAAMEARPGERILDACAGPGGKATELACAVAPGGTLVAADASPGRSALVARAAARLGVRTLVVSQDARRPAVTAGFDGVLVDAPCSGLGAARRRPELLWRPRREDLSRLARLQVAILCGGADLVRPGGRLVYSVCTFPRAETDAVARAFVHQRPAFAPADVPGPDGPASEHRLWPHRHGTDGMFIAGFVHRPQ